MANKIDTAGIDQLPRAKRDGERARRIIAANPGISDVDLGREIHSYTNPGKDVSDAVCLAEVKVLRADGEIPDPRNEE